MLETGGKQIDIWLVDDSQVVDIELLEQYDQLLNAEETGRHLRLLFSRHRHQFLVARALVRSVLAGYLGIDNPANVEFNLDGNGKPELAGDSPLQFNLSHTNGLVALAVTKHDPLGIDVEYLSRQVDILKLAKRYFSPEETQALQSLPLEERNARFFDLWTLKEAYLKACGTGLRTPLHAFSFILEGEEIGISFSNLIEDDPATWQFWQIRPEESFRLALAVQHQDGSDYKVTVRKGIPLREFTEISPGIFRQTR